MNEIQLILLGRLILGASVVFFFFTDLVPKQVTSTEMNVIVSLGVGLLIFIVDKRQNHYLDEIIQTQHKFATAELHPSYSLQDINTEMISGVAAPAMLKYPVLEVSKKDRIPRGAPNPRNYGEIVQSINSSLAELAIYR